MKKSLVLALVGMPGSGKTEAANFFRKKDIPVLRFGDITKKGLEEKHLEGNEPNERQYRETIRQELGMDAYAMLMEPEIKERLVKNNIVVVDGLRSYQEYIYLSKKLDNIKLLCIYAKPEVRHKRLKVRVERKMSEDEATKRDLAEVSALDMGKTIALSDYMIENEGTIDVLNEKLEKLIKEIEK